MTILLPTLLALYLFIQPAVGSCQGPADCNGNVCLRRGTLQGCYCETGSGFDCSQRFLPPFASTSLENLNAYLFVIQQLSLPVLETCAQLPLTWVWKYLMMLIQSHSTSMDLRNQFLLPLFFFCFFLVLPYFPSSLLPSLPSFFFLSFLFSSLLIFQSFLSQK